MIAPSERHLEDWICANWQEFGEVWEADDFPWGYGDAPFILDEKRVIVPFFSHLVQRQCVIPSGRVDLIGYESGCVSAIEMKKGTITYEVVGQCLRYIHDLMQVFTCTAHDIASDPESAHYIYTKPQNLEVATDYPDSEIIGMIVGHSIGDKNIPVVCAACGIRLVTYEFVDDRYYFTHVTEQRPSPDEYQYLVNSRIGQFIRLGMQHRSQVQNGGAK